VNVKWGVDDLLAVLGVLVLIEQQAVMWAFSVDRLPTREAFYAQILSNITTIWYIHPSYSCPFHVVSYAFTRHLRSLG
jgi:hypothetical protein